MEISVTKLAVFAAFGLLVLILLLAWAVTFIQYRITPRSLKVVWMGIPLRRVLLTNIESVSKRPGPGRTENWWNTFKPNHRILIIRRRRGLFRNFAITPTNRYVFRADLENAIQSATSASLPKTSNEEEPEAASQS